MFPDPRNQPEANLPSSEKPRKVVPAKTSEPGVFWTRRDLNTSRVSKQSKDSQDTTRPFENPVDETISYKSVRPILLIKQAGRGPNAGWGTGKRSTGGGRGKAGPGDSVGGFEGLRWGFAMEVS